MSSSLIYELEKNAAIAVAFESFGLADKINSERNTMLRNLKFGTAYYLANQAVSQVMTGSSAFTNMNAVSIGDDVVFDSACIFGLDVSGLGETISSAFNGFGGQYVGNILGDVAAYTLIDYASAFANSSSSLTPIRHPVSYLTGLA